MRPGEIRRLQLHALASERVLRLTIGLLCICLPVLLSGCGNGTRILPDTSLALGNSFFQALAGNCSVATDQNGVRYFSGNCMLLANGNLGGLDSARSFAVDFTLQDGGEITFHTFASSTGSNGLSLKFIRVGDVLRARVLVANRETNYDAQFSSISASGRVNLLIDVHNNELPAHLLIWPATAAPNFALANKLINSICGINGPRPPDRDCHNFSSSGRGQGEYFAVSLQNAELFQITIGPPKYAH